MNRQGRTHILLISQSGSLRTASPSKMKMAGSACSLRKYERPATDLFRITVMHAGASLHRTFGGSRSSEGQSGRRPRPVRSQSERTHIFSRPRRRRHILLCESRATGLFTPSTASGPSTLTHRRHTRILMLDKRAAAHLRGSLHQVLSICWQDRPTST